MKNLRLLILAISVVLFGACTSKSHDNMDSTSSPDSVEAPGVGAAPDNSRTADTTTLKNDTTGVN